MIFQSTAVQQLLMRATHGLKSVIKERNTKHIAPVEITSDNNAETLVTANRMQIS